MDNLIPNNFTYEEVKSTMDENFINNPEYEYMVDLELKDMYAKRERTRAKIGYNYVEASNEPTIEVVGGKQRVKETELSARLLDDGRMEVIKTTGTLFERDAYYKDINAPSGKLIVDVNCERHVFDKDGIELSNATYYKGGITILDDPSFSLNALLDSALSQKGVIVPKGWDDESGPIIPRESKDAYVSGSYRLTDLFGTYGASGIQEDYSFEVGEIETNENGETTYPHNNYMASLTRVNRDWPERLATDLFGMFKFAKLKDGQFVPTELYEGQSIDHLCKLMSHNTLEEIEYSKTKNRCPRQYEALRSRLSLEEANYSFAPVQEETTLGTHR